MLFQSLGLHGHTEQTRSVPSRASLADKIQHIVVIQRTVKSGEKNEAGNGDKERGVSHLTGDHKSHLRKCRLEKGMRS
jgi:hypothetical protein